jgi:hypothetical protein
MNGTYSPAGMSLFAGSSLSGDIGGETEAQKRKRLAGIAASQSRLGVSSAGSALSLGGYGTGGY